MGDTPKTVLAAKKALEARGHKLVSLENLIDSFEAFDVYSDLLLADNGKYIKEMLRNDEIGPSAQTLNLLMSLPSWKRRFLTRILPLSDRMRITASAGLDAEQAGGLYSKIGDKDSLRDGILKNMERYSLDLIISPVMPFPAPRKDVAYNLFCNNVFTVKT
ncbi:unnamed protein product [Allacma fusca]|uniref:Amidase domain-containing protein n=1 Tax=Allacma fusca TaxID=39272 RepID=A0A8J2K1J6_9HEXA|nr:unnamed protein product [Allacma fusca]